MAGGNVEDAFRCSAPPNANSFHAETAQPVFAAFVVIVPSQLGAVASFQMTPFDARVVSQMEYDLSVKCI
jgi:hypothetical protein